MTLSMSDSPFVQSPPAVGEEATLDNVPSVKPEGREGGREGRREGGREGRRRREWREEGKGEKEGDIIDHTFHQWETTYW